MAGFIFGEGTDIKDPRELARRRAVIDAMLAQGQRAPQNVGEGIFSASKSITDALVDKRLRGKEDAARKDAAGALPSIVAMLNGGQGGGSGGGLNYTPSGTFTAAPPPDRRVAPDLGFTPTFGSDKPSAASQIGFGGNSPAGEQELGFGSAVMTPQEMLIAGAEARGLDPIDVATAISYETGGKFDPVIPGPTTQWGRHRGLIQFGEPQAQQYGASFDDPDTAWRSQLNPNTGAVWRYLEDTGVTEGMGLPEIYSAINAGGVGRLNRTDANNGGAPGTVGDKIATMGPHRENAARFLGGTWTPSAQGSGQPAPQAAPAGNTQQAFNPEIINQLAALSSNPYASPGQQQIAQMLMQSQVQQMMPQDPMRALELERAQLENERLRNPQPDLTGTQREYEQAVQQGFQGSIVDYKTALAQAGRSQQNVNVGAGENAFDKKTGEVLATEANDVVTQAMQAQRSLGQISTLESALQRAPSGALGSMTNMAANLGIKTEGASDIELANSIISQLVPQQRPPGSGVMSDADLELFKQSLPRLINTREGNQQIVNTMRAIAEYDIKRGQIARQLQLGAINPQQAFDAYAALGNPVEAFKQGGGADTQAPADDVPTFNPQTGQWE